MAKKKTKRTKKKVTKKTRKTQRSTRSRTGKSGRTADKKKRDRTLGKLRFAKALAKERAEKIIALTDENIALKNEVRELAQKLRLGKAQGEGYRLEVAKLVGVGIAAAVVQGSRPVSVNVAGDLPSGGLLSSKAFGEALKS